MKRYYGINDNTTGSLIGIVCVNEDHISEEYLLENTKNFNVFDFELNNSAKIHMYSIWANYKHDEFHILIDSSLREKICECVSLNSDNKVEQYEYELNELRYKMTKNF